MSLPTKLYGNQIYLRLLETDDARPLLTLYVKNQKFLQPWEPARSGDFYTLAGIRYIIESSQDHAELDEAYSFGIFLSHQHEMIGRITLSGITRGIMQSARLGYFLAEKHNGKGYMTNAVSLVVQTAFKGLNLHRVSAATLLHNHASIKVLTKVGFRHEGIALRYLQINGTWQDHNIFAITAEEPIE